jgi:hypothetical protein
MRWDPRERLTRLLTDVNMVGSLSVVRDGVWGGKVRLCRLTVMQDDEPQQLIGFMLIYTAITPTTLCSFVCELGMATDARSRR